MSLEFPTDCSLPWLHSRAPSLEHLVVVNRGQCSSNREALVGGGLSLCPTHSSAYAHPGLCWPLGGWAEGLVYLKLGSIGHIFFFFYLATRSLGTFSHSLRTLVLLGKWGGSLFHALVSSIDSREEEVVSLQKGRCASAGGVATALLCCWGAQGRVAVPFRTMNSWCPSFLWPACRKSLEHPAPEVTVPSRLGLPSPLALCVLAQIHLTHAGVGHLGAWLSKSARYLVAGVLGHCSSAFSYHADAGSRL